MLLEEKIRNKTVRAGVIGLGYVGLPLAVEFAREGLRVTGIDIDERKVEQVSSGRSYVQDVARDDIQDLVSHSKLKVTTDFSVIRELDTVNICVPTPLRKSKDPDISFIIAVTEEIAKYLHSGMLVILESTTYPGTTEEVILPLLEGATGLRAGQDFFLAFSPERVDPGNPVYHTRNIPKVVGGYTRECGKLAALFYQLAIDQVHRVDSPRAAEMVKLLENTFRSVNIGLVNELCQMGEKLGVNIWEIIDAAATKPFGFMPFYPGPGLGGHCIPIDPHYLAWKARISGFTPRFIELADAVNSQMPDFVVKKAQDALNRVRKPLNGSRILILGVTYKKNVSDVRESPALLILKRLVEAEAEVSYSDPYVPALAMEGLTMNSVDMSEGAKDCDLAILITDHDAFDRAEIVNKFELILDTRNALQGPADRVVKM